MALLRLYARFVRIVLLGSALTLAWSASARAQDAYASVPPVYISFVEGDAMMAHEGQFEPAQINTPIVEGDRIRTRSGKVQVVFPDGTSIDINRQSDVVFLTNTRVTVLSGSIERHAAETIGGTYAAYLPQELQMHARTFSRYGSWQNEGPYGRVWYPRVANSWRPYSEGHWTPLRSYGWTWVGVDAWSWPTHHYGRWGYARGSWFWIPARAWAPAWVSWAAAPGFVTWCPLGVNGSPVFPLSIGSDNPWRGWTVVRRDAFGDSRVDARRPHVDPHHFTRQTPFILQSHTPVTMPMPGAAPPPIIRKGEPRGTATLSSAPPATGSVIAVSPGAAPPRSHVPTHSRTQAPIPTEPAARATEGAPAPAGGPSNSWPAIPRAGSSTPYALPRYGAPAVARPEAAVSAPPVLRQAPPVLPQAGLSPPMTMPFVLRHPHAPAATERAPALDRMPPPERSPSATPPPARSAPPREADAPAAPAAVLRRDPATQPLPPATAGVRVKRPG